MTNEEFGFEKIRFGAMLPCYLDDYGLVYGILLRVWSYTRPVEDDLH